VGFTLTDHGSTQRPSDGGGISPPSPFMAGLRCRCPRCGKGQLYRGFLSLREGCPICGLDYSKADTGDGPAVFIILIVGAVVVLLAVLTEIWYMPPYWLHALLWPPLILALSLGLLRPAKALMIALQFRHQASEGGAARFE
jgi:uncharacterized protein (DUF983 family)